MLKNRSLNQALLNRMRGGKIFLFLVLALFIISSFLFISPKKKTLRSNYRSNQLEKVTEKSENTVKTYFIDSSGKVVFAADQGYATVITTYTDNGNMEKYYDEEGKPVKRSDGYYAVLREYDNANNNIRNTYLDAEGIPMMTLSGYAIMEREYNENKKVINTRYFDTEGNPVCTKLYGYGSIYVYDDTDGKYRITYVDVNDEPMMTSQGYASCVRFLYLSEGPQKGRIESELYYDESGKPIALSLGQYGIHKEYDDNGQEAVLTYLDADGNPIITNKGYTTIVRTYHANNTVATEQYYDLKGNPYSLSEGQYGIKTEEGKTIYLDQDGRETFNIRNVLYNHSWLVIPCTFLLIIFTNMIKKQWNAILLILYMGVILYFTLLFRDSNGVRKTGALLYYRSFFSNSESRADILKTR